MPGQSPNFLLVIVTGLIGDVEGRNCSANLWGKVRNLVTCLISLRKNMDLYR